MRAAYFGGDITNPTLILRISSFRSIGIDVRSFTFRRQKFNVGFRPAWTNYHLGSTTDRHYRIRLLAIVRACWIIIRQPKAFEEVDFLYARMIDMAFLAQFAKWWHGLTAPLVYEVEDVQAVFFKTSLAGAFFRWIERKILARTKLLVVMSPGFMRGYFIPIQNYSGPFFVLENKLQLAKPVPSHARAVGSWQTERNKWIIGWNGTLRCARSMRYLSEIATALGDRVEIRTRGYPTETGLGPYLDLLSRHPNWHFDGEYKIPDDLEGMYGRVHFSWCMDFLDVGGNSELLLACRMYQGGYYGAVPLVAAGSEMERFLEPHGIGHSFVEPIAESVANFLQRLTFEDYEAERLKVLSLGDKLFLDTGDDVRRLLAAINGRPQELTGRHSID